MSTKMPCWPSAMAGQKNAETSHLATDVRVPLDALHACSTRACPQWNWSATSGSSLSRHGRCTNVDAGRQQRSCFRGTWPSSGGAAARRNTKCGPTCWMKGWYVVVLHTGMRLTSLLTAGLCACVQRRRQRGRASHGCSGTGAHGGSHGVGRHRSAADHFYHPLRTDDRGGVAVIVVVIVCITSCISDQRRRDDGRGGAVRPRGQQS